MERFRRDHPELDKYTFKSWYLETAQISPIDSEPRFQQAFDSQLDPDWNWCDPFEDCSHAINKGLIIRAANERNLYHINRSAPRLLRTEPVRGDFTLQCTCQTASKTSPAIGGLLVWLSDKYWFCLEMGGRGPGEVLLRGYMNNYDLIFGRGLMKAKKLYLRLERRGNWLSAFCSANGKNWNSAGGCELSSVEPLYLGVHAIGHINRLVYPGAYPQGTAIRISEFWLWDH